MDLLTIGWIKNSSNALDNIVAAEKRLMLVVRSGMVQHDTAKRGLGLCYQNLNQRPLKCRSL